MGHLSGSKNSLASFLLCFFPVFASATGIEAPFPQPLPENSELADGVAYARADTGTAWRVNDVFGGEDEYMRLLDLAREADREFGDNGLWRHGAAIPYAPIPEGGIGAGLLRQTVQYHFMAALAGEMELQFAEKYPESRFEVIADVGRYGDMETEYLDYWRRSERIFLDIGRRGHWVLPAEDEAFLAKYGYNTPIFKTFATPPAKPDPFREFKVDHLFSEPMRSCRGTALHSLWRALPLSISLRHHIYGNLAEYVQKLQDREDLFRAFIFTGLSGNDLAILPYFEQVLASLDVGAAEFGMNALGKALRRMESPIRVRVWEGIGWRAPYEFEGIPENPEVGRLIVVPDADRGADCFLAVYFFGRRPGKTLAADALGIPGDPYCRVRDMAEGLILDDLWEKTLDRFVVHQDFNVSREEFKRFIYWPFELSESIRKHSDRGDFLFEAINDGNL